MMQDDYMFEDQAPVRPRRRLIPRPHLGRVSRRWWLAAGAGLVVIGVGFGGGYLSAQLSGDQAGRDDEVAQLSEQVDALREAISLPAQGAEDGESGAADVAQSITDRVLEATRAAAPDRTASSIVSLAQRFESDRLLLAEMRKSPPQEPRDAQRYWLNIKPLAVRSDPSLGQKVDRVARYLPAYLDWVMAEPGTQGDPVAGLRESGANNYFRAVDEFWQAVLLVVIDRIDVLAGLALE
jgi:hypothetical protein